MFKNLESGKERLAAGGIDPEWLPHLTKFKLYRWAWDFIHTLNRLCFCVGGNQISKSSTAIRKNIHLATSPELWPVYFSQSATAPRQFWYLLPDASTVRREFDDKWAMFMPSVPKGHPYESRFGWKPVKDGGRVIGVKFNTGVSIFFFTYSQQARFMQASTVHMVTCDEEPPKVYIDELMARLQNPRGIFNTCFTATLAQYFLYLAMERIGEDDENYKDAFKRIVSVYDCLTYVDGSPSIVWTPEKIAQYKASMSSEAEVQKRVYGRFVPDSGLAFYKYKKHKTVAVNTVLDPLGEFYPVVDPGSGGIKGHPTGIVVLAVNSSKTQMDVVSCWRGDGIETASVDIVRQVQKMMNGLKYKTLIYDHAAADFRMTAEKMLPGIEILGANKDRHFGFSTTNAYLTEGMIKIHMKKSGSVHWFDSREMEKLHQELQYVQSGSYLDTGRNRRIDTKKGASFPDDLTDCLRYGCAYIRLDIGAVQVKSSEARPPLLVKQGRWEYFSDELEAGRAGVADVNPSDYYVGSFGCI